MAQLMPALKAVGGAAAGGLTIATYHHFASHDAPATRHLGITTRPDRLAAQLDYLASTYNVIALERLLAGDIPSRALLITIDDAYRSVFEIAAPMLAERNLPAVLFLNPRPVTEAFVPTDVVLSLLGGPDARSAMRRAIAETAGEEWADKDLNAVPLDRREAAKKRLIATLDTTEADLHRALELFLTPQQVRALPGLGIDIANHTMSHSLCRTLTAPQRHQEIAVSKDAIENLSGTPVRAFAFPWGQTADATPKVLDEIRGSGHRATFLMQGLNNTKRPASDIWYRCLLTSETPAGVALSLRLKPRLRTLLRGLPSLPRERPG